MLTARGPDSQRSISVIQPRHDHAECFYMVSFAIVNHVVFITAASTQHPAYVQIELGAGAGISCLASLLQLRGTAKAQPHHTCGTSGDVLLFNGEPARSTT